MLPGFSSPPILLCDAEPKQSIRVIIYEEGVTDPTANPTASVLQTRETFVVSNYAESAVFVTFKRQTNVAQVGRYVSFILDGAKSYTLSSNVGEPGGTWVGKRDDVVLQMPCGCHADPGWCHAVPYIPMHPHASPCIPWHGMARHGTWGAAPVLINLLLFAWGPRQRAFRPAASGPITKREKISRRARATTTPAACRSACSGSTA
jgi:hypothetical protein